MEFDIYTLYMIYMYIYIFCKALTGAWHSALQEARDWVQSYAER